MLEGKEAAARKAEVAKLYPEGPIAVVSLRKGYYDHQLRKEGTHFTIAEHQAFSARWMKLAEGGPVSAPVVDDVRHPTAFSSNRPPASKPGREAEHQDKVTNEPVVADSPDKVVKKKPRKAKSAKKVKTV